MRGTPNPAAAAAARQAQAVEWLRARSIERSAREEAARSAAGLVSVSTTCRTAGTAVAWSENCISIDRHASRVSPLALSRRLDTHGQTLRVLERRIDAIMDVNIERRDARLHRAALRLRLEPIEEKLRARRRRLDQAERLLKSVSYQSILDRGFALVTDEAGTLVRRAADIARNAALLLEFADGKVDVIATRGEAPKSKHAPNKSGGTQGSLF